MKKSNTEPTLEQRNEAITASFQAIISETKELIAGLTQEMLRHTILMEGNNFTEPKLLEFMTPLTYLCLRDSTHGYVIHFGFDQSEEYAGLADCFIRMIYKLTMDGYTTVTIEDCVKAHGTITDTSYLFDEMQWKHPLWPVVVIKYKPSKKQRKQSKAVA